MARSTLGATVRSKSPPIPPEPSQLVEIRTSEAASCGETVNVVMALELVSDSVRIRPGSGSATTVRYSRVRPPAVSLKRVTVPAPTPPDSTRKSENAGGKEPRMVLAHIRDVAVDRIRQRVHRALSGSHNLRHEVFLSPQARRTHMPHSGWQWHGEIGLLATRWQRWLGRPALPACAIVCAWMRTYGMPTTGWA